MATEMIWDGRHVERFETEIEDTQPRLLKEYLSGDGNAAREALLAMATRAGRWAAFRLVASLEGQSRSSHPYPAKLCGPGPVIPSDEEGHPGSTGQSIEELSQAPAVELDPVDPIIAWEKWEPRSEPVPANARVRYDFRLWSATSQFTRGELLHAENGLEEPRISLRGRLEREKKYLWSARAILNFEGRRLATEWSSLHAAPKSYEPDARRKKEPACGEPARGLPLMLRLAPK
jgi:hypothetical protein